MKIIERYFVTLDNATTKWEMGIPNKHPETKPIYDREGNYVGEWNGELSTGAKYQSKRIEAQSTQNPLSALPQKAIDSNAKPNQPRITGMVDCTKTP